MNHFSSQCKRAMTVSAIAIIAAMSFAATAMAQTPTRLRGTIEKISGDSIAIQANGTTARYAIAHEATFMAVTHTDVSAIKPDSFIGTAAMPQADGTLRALEVHVFPPGMKSGEGHYAWDLGSNSSMTNGTVGSVVVSSGHTITVKYPNGEQKIVVPPNVPVVSLEKGDRSLLVPGAHGVFVLTRSADGAQVISRGSVGKDGVVPPM